MLLLSAMHTNASLKALLKALHLFSNMPSYGKVVVILILANCYEITNIKLTFKIRLFHKNLMLQKFGAIWYVMNVIIWMHSHYQ